MSNCIYIHELGWRNPLTEYNQIIWFLEQKSKIMNDRTRYRFWINLREQYESKLLNMAAYELVGFVKSQVTDEKYKETINRRAKAQLFRAKQEAIAKKALESKINAHKIVRNYNLN